MKKILFPLLFISIIPLTGCQKEDVSNTIYTSIYPVYDFVNRIVGDKYKVVNFTPAGVEPHDYELSMKQIVNIADAKATFINGLNIESWYDDLPNQAKNKTHIVSEDIQIIQTEGQDDPHIWLSLKNAIKEMNNICSYMCEIDSANSDYYKNNLTINTALFNELDALYTTETASFINKNIVVAHAAFGYLCKEYGLNQIAVNGIDPEQEPSSKTIEEIVKKVNEYHINTIFTEEMVSDKIAKQIAKECNVKIDVLNPIETLEGEENYLSVMKDNLNRLKEACK